MISKLPLSLSKKTHTLWMSFAWSLSDANDNASDYDAAEEAVANLGRGSTCLHDALRRRLSALALCASAGQTDGLTQSAFLMWLMDHWTDLLAFLHARPRTAADTKRSDKLRTYLARQIGINLPEFRFVLP